MDGLPFLATSHPKITVLPMLLKHPMEAIGVEATTEASCFPPVILGGGGWWGAVVSERMYRKSGFITGARYNDRGKRG